MLRMATSPASGRGEERNRSVRLGEALLRDGDAHLSLLRLHEIGEREHGAVGGATQQSDNHQKTDQARHGGNPKRFPAKCIAVRRRKRVNPESSIRDSGMPAAGSGEPGIPVRQHAEATNHHVPAELARGAGARYMLLENQGEWRQRGCQPEPGQR